MKICLLGATFSTSNMGVGALTAGTIKAILHQFPDPDISLLDYGKESVTYAFGAGNRSISIRLVNLRFSKKFYLKNNIALLLFFSFLLKLIPFKQMRNKFISKNFYLNHISEANIVGSIAGGDSFSDIYGLGRFFYVSLPQLLVLMAGKGLVLLPQTIGPFRGLIARAVARYIIKRAGLIYLRDYAGKEELENLLGEVAAHDKARFCYDVGFAVAPVQPEKMDLNGWGRKEQGKDALVGLNVSGLLFRGGYTQNNQFGLKTDYRLLVNKLIGYLVEKKGARVLMVPHVFGEGEKSESDQEVCGRIYAELKPKYKDSLYFARGRYDQSEIKYIIGLCDFFIGSRMHACIGALSQNIPTVSIAYSKKFIGVMETIGVGKYVADLRTMSKEEIFRIIDKAWVERAEIREHLEQKMPEVKARVLSLFEEIARSYRFQDEERGER